MKIGIITILKVNNYGAELQAYATQEVLKKLGYEAEIIDYLFYKNPCHRRTKASAPVFPFPIVTQLKEWLYPKMAIFKAIGNFNAQKLREKRFADFHKDNTSLSPTYHSMEELYSAKLPYDVYLTGSDQVWNPGIYSSLEPYFLTFAPKNKRRIAYAASFGVDRLPVGTEKYYISRLKAYNAIGVREKTAVNLIRNIAGVTAQWVLDPTLLLTYEDWNRVSKPVPLPSDTPYILLYELTPCPYMRRLAQYIKQETCWQIVRICKSSHREDKLNDGIFNIVDAGPAEFLHLFAHAELVITNSFHGTAFSINFQRDFYTVLPLRKKNNSRQLSLLQLVNLTERMLVENSPMPTNIHVDYEQVNALLQDERKKSVNFLKEAIYGK